MLAALTLAALLAPWIAPQNPYDLAAITLTDSNLPPRWSPPTTGTPSPNVHGTLFLLGSDRQGRDILSAMLYGLRVSLFVGIAGTFIALLVGVPLGLLAGYFGGWWDGSIMRAADIQLAFPSVLIAFFLMAIWGQGELTIFGPVRIGGVGKIIIAVGIVHWVLYARIVRGVALAEREKDYISAVRALGAHNPRILFLHLLPNLSSPILVISAIQFASIVMLEATLSYLGLGVPITRPSLGMLIRFGYDEFFSGNWWVWFFPGLTLVMVIVAINWLADDLRDMFSVKG